MSNGVLGEKLHVKVARHERCKKVCLHLLFFFLVVAPFPQLASFAQIAGA